VSAWVTDEELAAVRARGFDPVATIADKNLIDHIRAERDATLAARRTAERALRVNEAGRRGASAAAGTVRLQRAVDRPVAGDGDGLVPVQRAARDRRVGTRRFLLRRDQAACRRVVSLVRYLSPSSSLSW